MRDGFSRRQTARISPGQLWRWNFAMVRGAALEGRFLKDTGESAENVVVSAMRIRTARMARRATSRVSPNGRSRQVPREHTTLWDYSSKPRRLAFQRGNSFSGAS